MWRAKIVARASVARSDPCLKELEWGHDRDKTITEDSLRSGELKQVNLTSLLRRHYEFSGVEAVVLYLLNYFRIGIFIQLRRAAEDP